jgi:hypothetical protein
MAVGDRCVHTRVIRASRFLVVAALSTLGCAPAPRALPLTPATPPALPPVVGAGGPSRPSDPSCPSLRTDVAPGGNFTLTGWMLEEPIGAFGRPQVIAGAGLAGPSGFHDDYFFTDPHDGAMTFFAPENGVHTPHSRFPRSELAEQGDDGRRASWPVAGTNVLAATVAVAAVPHHVCVGQIHVSRDVDPALPRSTKPLVELYYYADGSIVVGVEKGLEGGQSTHALGTVPLGRPFQYEIKLAGNGTITIMLNGAVSTFPMPEAFRAYGMYFKAGAYNQSTGSSAAVGARVKFYALAVSHSP